MALALITRCSLTTLRPPLPQYVEVLSMLHCYDSIILLQEATTSSQQVAFVENKANKAKYALQRITSKN